MTIADDLIRDLEAETEKTRALLAVVPEQHLAWKPHARSMTLGALASHLAENPAWISSMLEDEMDMASMGDYRPFEGHSRAELLEGLERNLRDGTAALRGRADAQLAGAWTMRDGPKVLMRAPRHEAIRAIALHHWIHHRGQLTVYLRMLDVPLPQTYGPTADAPTP